MPVYEYRCNRCGKVGSFFFRSSSPATDLTCPACQSTEMSRVAESTSEKHAIPAFETAEEEAAFWDTHDSEAVDERWQKTRLKVSPDLKHVLSVRLEPGTIDELTKAARSLGIGPSTLVRMWILEKLATLKPEKAEAVDKEIGSWSLPPRG